MDIEIAPDGEGNAPGSAFYVVMYDENRWNRFNEESKQFCLETWARKAAPMKCTHVILRLVPDPLFPSGGHTVPYVAVRHPIVRETPKFTVKTSTIVTIDYVTYEAANELERVKLRNAARALALRNTPPKGPWVVQIFDGALFTTIEKGGR